MLAVGEAIARRAHALDHRFGRHGRGWIVWVCFALLVLLARLDSTDSIENVFTVYREAGLRWLHGQDLYPAQFRFNYFPPSAVFFAAWGWLPFALAGALWRIVNIAVFAFGLWKLCGCGERSVPATRFFIATVVTVVLSASAARYGQMTLAMSGLMMAAVADVEAGALWRAALLAALAVAAKPLALVLVLLLVALYPRLTWRTAIALAGCFALPFLFQHWDYVLRQYAALPDMLTARAHQHYEWQHVFGLLEKLGWLPTDVEQTLLRGVAAVAVLYLCWRAKRRTPAIGVALSVYTLATCYILLFGSATERNTYAMIAPVVGVLAAAGWHARDRQLLTLTTVIAWLMLLSHTLSVGFPHTPLAMAKPIACCILLGWVTWQVIRAPDAARGPAR